MLPEFSCRFGEHFVKRNQFRQAIFWYELALRDADNETSGWAVREPAYQTWLPHQQLGLCYYRIGDYHQSLHHNRLAHRYLPHDAGIETNIGILENLTTP